MNCRHGIDTTADYCASCAVDEYNLQLREANNEIDRLSSELDHREYLLKCQLEEIIRVKEISDNLALGVEELRAELAKAQEENKALRNRLQIDPSGSDEIDTLEMSNELLRHRAEAAEARCKELELTLSGRTMCYDPDSYAKGRIAGMEVAAKIAENTAPGESESAWLVVDAIRTRIESAKGEGK